MREEIKAGLALIALYLTLFLVNRFASPHLGEPIHSFVSVIGWCGGLSFALVMVIVLLLHRTPKP